MASVQDIYDEITRIDNAKQGIAEAIEEKGVQVPEESRIGEYPGLVRQIQTGSPDAVLYTPQELTPEQQEQARENIGAGTYTKPGTGIPKTDLSEGVQTSLGKADTALQPVALNPITELIPEQATPQNQLADKNFVNSSVATNTANYISDNGQPFQSVADLEAYTGTLTNNDYAFVVGTDSAGNTTYTRYKYNANTQTWAAEYVLNNSSFTAEQWAAISSGITALLVQKLSNLPTEVVTYVVQTLTEAQKQQARTNIGATAPEVFWATYGTTTAAEIDAAVAAGKMVVCAYNSNLYVLASYTAQGTYIEFARTAANWLVNLRLTRSNGSWSTASFVVEQTSNKAQTIEGNETNTSKYPSTKAVADALGKMGVVSQTLSWRSAGDGGTDYVISNIVRGIVSYHWIQLFESMGATFNDNTGYFELNELTDIALDEMLKMFAAYSPVVQPQQYYGSNLRTVFQQKGTSIYSVGAFARQANRLITYPAFAGYDLIISYPSDVFYGCVNLRKCLCRIYRGVSDTNFFFHCYRLEEVRILSLDKNIFFTDSPLLSLYSVWFMVNGRSGSAAITITLHATAYARCQADTTEYTYNEQTYTGIIAYAAAKNITIASA